MNSVSFAGVVEETTRAGGTSKQSDIVVQESQLRQSIVGALLVLSTLLLGAFIRSPRVVADNEIQIEVLPLTEFFPNAGFPEGPTVDKRGHLYFTGKSAIHHTDEQGNLLQSITTGGNPVGTVLMTNGNVAVTDSILHAILEVRADGFYRILANECDGEPLVSPNDICSHKDGRLYFLDVADSSKEKASGRVYVLQSSGKVVQIAEGLYFPAGIALSTDGKSLFVSENGTGKILRYSLKSDGTAGERAEFAKLEPESPTGLRFDEYGNLWVGQFGKGVVSAINKEGKLARMVDAGGNKPTNLVFTGTSLLITEAEKKRIVRVNVGIKGARLPAG